MGFENNAMISHIDILPTILDWVGMELPYKVYSPKYEIPNRLSRMIGLEEKDYYTLPGRSLLPILDEKNPSEWNTIFASHTFHEVTMYYPMRSIRTREFKYILNIANGLDYPFATDLWESLTWQGLLERNSNKLGIKSIESYLLRPKEELYDLKKDPYESNNLADNPEYKEIIADLRKRLKSFQASTQDIWLLKYNYWEKIEKLKERYK
jgi:N-sulfoglucosamine sulfohydrolase